MLHLGDKVQEISTGRQGKIDETRSEGVSGKEQIPILWRVTFSDGNTPLIHDLNKEELRLIDCPHGEPEPGFVPERGIIE